MAKARRRVPHLTGFPLAVWERDGLRASLIKVGLPADDVGDASRLFWRFEAQDHGPVGFGGLEVHGHDALLRSIVTLPPLRKSGVGGRIVTALEAEASMAGARTIWLLTVSAADFFDRLGYAKCERVSLPDAIRDSAEFTAHATSAAVMVKRLG
jgi:amino-acid N-acetyltransferase